MRHVRNPPSKRPWVLLETDDPERELHDEDVRRFASLIGAANAFAGSTAPFRSVIYDNGHEQRDLDEREEGLLVGVCRKLGLDVEDL